jgi:hypothetical protein
VYLVASCRDHGDFRSYYGGVMAFALNMVIVCFGHGGLSSHCYVTLASALPFAFPMVAVGLTMGLRAATMAAFALTIVFLCFVYGCLYSH